MIAFGRRRRRRKGRRERRRWVTVGGNDGRKLVTNHWNIGLVTMATGSEISKEATGGGGEGGGWEWESLNQCAQNRWKSNVTSAWKPTWLVGNWSCDSLVGRPPRNEAQTVQKPPIRMRKSSKTDKYPAPSNESFVFQQNNKKKKKKKKRPTPGQKKKNQESKIPQKNDNKRWKQ